MVLKSPTYWLTTQKLECLCQRDECTSGQTRSLEPRNKSTSSFASDLSPRSHGGTRVFTYFTQTSNVRLNSYRFVFRFPTCMSRSLNEQLEKRYTSDLFKDVQQTVMLLYFFCLMVFMLSGFYYKKMKLFGYNNQSFCHAFC